LTLRPLCALLLTAATLHAEPILVRHTEGRSRGFVVLRSASGTILGNGEMTQLAHGDHVTYRMTYRFKDGSFDDETATFSQRHTLQLITDHHIQRGPFFAKPLDLTIEASGQITSRTIAPDGTPKVEVTQADLPPDLSNGFLCTIMENLLPNTPEFKMGMVVPAEKFRLIKLDVAPAGQGRYTIAGVRRTASIFRLKTELGGLTGVVAPLIGKQPADIYIWVAEGEAPATVRAIAQLAEGAPLLSIELAGATFPLTPDH
jgi:hypothetical protein